MASDLMTAMLTGQNQSPLMADPNTMALIPQMSLAQAMMQQGISGAPAYPAQALGRLAQALVGSHMMNGLGEQISGAYDRSAEAMGKIYPEGTPIGDMLRSKDPYLKMQGVQMGSKAALVNSEQKAVEPQQTIVAPRTPTVAGGVVGAGSPTQAGAVAGERKKAEGPYEFPGTVTMETPRGREEIRANVPTLQRLQPPAAPPTAPSGPPLPPASVPTVMKPNREPGFISRPAVPAEKPPAPPSAPAIESVKPMTPSEKIADRWPQYGGTPVRTPEYEGRMEAEKGVNKDFVEKGAQNYEAAQNLMGRLATMDHNIEALGPRWMGAGANAKGEFGKAWNSMLDSAGVKGMHIDPMKIATWEEFNKESTRAGMELIKSNFGGSREAASIIQMGAGAVPSAQQTYMGAKYNAASIKAATQREIDLYEYKAQRLKEGQSLVGADADFNKLKPPESYAMRGIVSVIPPAAIQHLQANPALAAHFDKQFGAGTAEYLLGKK